MTFRNRSWTSRRKRRGRSLYINKQILLAALLVLAVFVVRGRLGPHHETGPRPFSPQPEETVEGVHTDDFQLHLWQRLLGDSLPGLESPSLEAGEIFAGTIAEVFYSLTGVDPRDPRSILDLELGLGDHIPLPCLDPPASALPPSAGGVTGEPAADGDTGSDETEAGPAYPFPFQGYTDPVVLLYHTHITESFVPTSNLDFTTNLDLTVAACGDELAKLLQKEYGLSLIHNKEIFDLPRREAYSKARPVIKDILAANEQVDLVIDLHRDGMPRAVTTAKIDGQDIGKIMIVIGTNHPGYESNYRFAMRLQRALEELAPGISRGVRRHAFVYNQDLHERAILIEVGGHENSLDEALAAIPYLAEAIAQSYYNTFFIER